MKKLTTSEAATKSSSCSKVVCDLCHDQQPSLYCSSDSAFLCFDCDSQVHTANFLVARHIRFPISSLSKSCHPSSTNCHDDDASSSSSSSDVVCLEGDGSTKTSYTNNSKTTTTTTTTTSDAAAVDHVVSSDWKTRDVLVDWCRRLIGGASSDGRVIKVARHAFQVWYWWQQDRPDHRVWPHRVGLAASLWFGLLQLTKDNVVADDMNSNSNSSNNNNNRRTRLMRSLLKRLEEISGVPAKAIVVAQSKLTAAAAATFKHRRRRQQQLAAHQLTQYDHDATLEESSAEC